MTTNTNNSDTFRIYVASLSDYNAGILHGTWIDFDQLADLGDLRASIAAMLATSPTAKATGQPAEEWAIHAYEGWCGLSLSEYENLDTLWDNYETLSSLLEEGYSPDAIRDYAEWSGDDRFDDPFKEAFEEAYVGQYDSEREFAEELADDTGGLKSVPDNLRWYFDYDAFARDLFLTDYYRSDSGHVFRTC